MPKGIQHNNNIIWRATFNILEMDTTLENKIQTHSKGTAPGQVLFLVCIIRTQSHYKSYDQCLQVLAPVLKHAKYITISEVYWHSRDLGHTLPLFIPNE